jgi:hypothetical protein
VPFFPERLASLSNRRPIKADGCESTIQDDDVGIAKAEALHDSNQPE